MGLDGFSEAWGQKQSGAMGAVPSNTGCSHTTAFSQGLGGQRDRDTGTAQGGRATLSATQCGALADSWTMSFRQNPASVLSREQHN